MSNADRDEIMAANPRAPGMLDPSQPDRDVAADMFRHWGWPEFADAVAAGEHDENLLVQAFAQHARRLPAAIRDAKWPSSTV